MFGNNNRAARVRVFVVKHVPAFRWEAEVNGVTCTKDWTTYKTVAAAVRSARNWCRRTGLDAYTSVDDDCTDFEVK